MNEEELRLQFEEEDRINTTIPPDDIIAFNEQRSCADLFRMYNQKQLDISPDFQRGIVWSPLSQTLFVDSLIKQLPIPSMCISLDCKTQKRYVIDGLQRISTIIKFLSNDDWKLSCTKDIDPRISGKTVREIKDSDDLLFEKVENMIIPITILRCDYTKPNHMEYLFHIFSRLNSGGNKLYNQEIRNCVFQGPFNSFLKEIVRTDYWKNFAKVDDSQIITARFSNEERVLRFLAFYYEQNQYNGRLASFLNNFMEKNRIPSQDKIESFQKLVVDTLIIATKLRIPEDIFKNKNLVEGILVGIAHNISNLTKLSSSAIQTRLNSLLKEPPYSNEIREGLAHTDKVLERLNTSIKCFSK